LLHHSDRGCQYTSWSYQRALRQLGLGCSMSRKGNCWDNAVETFYNPKRQHSALGYLSPSQYELRWRAEQQAA
jgi:putative transposase